MKCCNTKHMCRRLGNSTKSMDLNTSWDAIVYQPTSKCLLIMEPEDSLHSSQVPANGPYLKPDKTLWSPSLRPITYYFLLHPGNCTQGFLTKQGVCNFMLPDLVILIILYITIILFFFRYWAGRYRQQRWQPLWLF